MHLGTGRWVYHLHVKYLTKSEALSLELKIKNSRKNSTGATPLAKRIDAISKYVNSDKIAFF